MLWFKALHLIFMVTWFAGLFYLPRLFVYHAMSEDKKSIDRFKIMEKKLFYGITTPGGLLTIIFGFCLLITNGIANYNNQLWFWLKMILILFLVCIIFTVSFYYKILCMIGINILMFGIDGLMKYPS